MNKSSENGSETYRLQNVSTSSKPLSDQEAHRLACLYGRRGQPSPGTGPAHRQAIKAGPTGPRVKFRVYIESRSPDPELAKLGETMESEVDEPSLVLLRIRNSGFVPTSGTEFDPLLKFSVPGREVRGAQPIDTVGNSRDSLLLLPEDEIPETAPPRPSGLVATVRGPDYGDIGRSVNEYAFWTVEYLYTYGPATGLAEAFLKYLGTPTALSDLQAADYTLCPADGRGRAGTLCTEAGS